MKRLMRLLATVLLASTALSRTANGQASDDQPRLRYNNALGYLRQQRYVDAIHDFQSVVDSYPSSAVADDALLEIAKYQLDIAREPALAKAAVDRLLSKYPESNSAPAGYVVAGRVLLSSSRAATDMSTALSHFERVPTYYPRSTSVAEAIYWAGETQRLSARLPEALALFGKVASDYPTSAPWAARAQLGAALCLVTEDQPFAAMEALQRIRVSFPQSKEAETALAWNTQLYRLYVKSATQPLYAFSGKTVGGAGDKFLDVGSLAVDAADTLHVLTRTGVTSYKPDATAGRPTESSQPRGLFTDRQGRLLIIQRGGVKPEDGAMVPFQSTKPDGTPRLLTESSTAVAWSTGEYLINDPPTHAVLRFSPQGKWLGVFAPGRPIRLSVNSLDEVATLVKDEKRVSVLGRDGKVIRQIGPRVDTVDLRNPVDMTFDALGHLFVLDRGRGSVMAFSPTGKLAASFTIPEKAPGNLYESSAMCLDSAGRLFVYDELTAHVQIYE